MSKEYLRRLGATLTGAIILQDMTKDLPSEIRTGRFNPLKGVSTNSTKALAKKHNEAFKNLADPVLALTTKPFSNPVGRGNSTPNCTEGLCPDEC